VNGGSNVLDYGLNVSLGRDLMVAMSTGWLMETVVVSIEELALGRREYLESVSADKCLRSCTEFWSRKIEVLEEGQHIS
jgi:hypothetical protein